MTEVQSYVMSNLSIKLFKTNIITQFLSIKVFFLIGYLRNIYRIQSNIVYIKTHFKSHVSTSMYLVYRCELSSGTNHLNNLRATVIKTIVFQCVRIKSLITGVITEYMTDITGEPEFLHRNTGDRQFWTK